MDVPDDVLAELRRICLGLPEAFEEQAWVGTRWKVRTRTFAHVVTVEKGWPEAYAKAFERTADAPPVVTLTFRSPGLERDALIGGGHPFYAPPWAPDVVGMVLDEHTDWTEVAELLTESFCALAPRKLADRVARPAEEIP
jgi:YjbR protein